MLGLSLIHILFKTVLFGGFQKEEVWNYMQEVEAEIEGGRQVAERAQQEYAQQLEEENLMRQKLSQQLLSLIHL